MKKMLSFLNHVTTQTRRCDDIIGREYIKLDPEKYYSENNYTE
jgi:hypothetical protein